MSDAAASICDESEPAWQTVLSHFPRGGEGGSAAEAAAQREQMRAAVAALPAAELVELAAQAGVAVEGAEPFADLEPAGESPPPEFWEWVLAASEGHDEYGELPFSWLADKARS